MQALWTPVQIHSPLNAIIQFSVTHYYRKFEKGYLGHWMCMAFSYLFGLLLKLDWTTPEIVSF